MNAPVSFATVPTVAVAISHYVKAESAVQTAESNKATARVECLLATIQHGEVSPANVLEYASKAGKTWSEGTAGARASEFNTGARLVSAMKGADAIPQALALVREVWDKATGDRAAAVFLAVRAAIKAARDGGDAAAAAHDALDADKAQRAARHGAPKPIAAPAAPVGDITAPQSRAVDLSSPAGRQIALAAMLVDVKAMEVPVKIEAAHTAAVHALEHAQLALAQLAMLTG